MYNKIALMINTIDLISSAVLAPSSHNVQPWKFKVTNDGINVYLDETRWMKVVDRDKRNMYISVGSALENILIAATHAGFKYKVSFFPETKDDTLVARVDILGEQKPALQAPLFSYIDKRQTNHNKYLKQPVSDEDLATLDAAVDDSNIQMFMYRDSENRKKIYDLIIEADTYQFSDPDFRQELGSWIGKGILGTPWILSKITELIVKYSHDTDEAAKADADKLMTAPVIALMCTKENGRESEVKVGQAFERVYLTATKLGLSIQPVTQLVEVAQTKTKLAGLLTNRDLFVQQVFRLGYATPETSHRPRRTVEDVLIPSSQE